MISQWEQFTMAIKNIALFGGAFNPITVGHQATALAVVANTGMELWYMPCYDHRFGKELLPIRHRSMMCHFASNETNQILQQMFDVNTFEADIQHNGSTYEMLKKLEEQYPKERYRFHVVIGMDNANQIDKWHNSEQLIEEYSFIVMTRGGSESEVDWYKNEKHQLVEIGWKGSSTDFRELMAQKNYKKAKTLVSTNVWSYIRAEKLYGFGEAE